MQCKKLIEMTQPEVERELVDNGMIILPTGSVEQHGPHLPMGTDYYAVMAIAERAAAQLGGLLVPFPEVGVTPFHMGFAGTLSLSLETYMNVLRDICESLIRHGAKTIIVINWHEGNTPAINTACTRLQVEYPEAVIVISQACYIAEQLYSDIGLSHAGTLEVLPVLSCRPELVHLDRATNAAPPERAKRMDALRRRREAYPIIPDVRIMYKSGWYGDLSAVSEVLAEEFLTRVSGSVVDSVRQTLAEMAGIRR